MKELRKFYINGAWVAPTTDSFVDIRSPATEEISVRVAMGEAADVDRAVAAARAAFPAYAATSRDERIALLERVRDSLAANASALADAIEADLGAPRWLVEQAQVWMPQEHVRIAIDALKNYRFLRPLGNTMVRMAPAGVCGLVTPWNWPVATIICKVVPALAMGCTIVLKPSEFSPLSSEALVRALETADIPPGVLNMLHGTGSVVGRAMASHPQIDLISITGSTRAGVDVAIQAAPTVKRVHQELGGKSPNILLPDANYPHAVAAGIKSLMFNSGQSCSAPSRMLVPVERIEEVENIARKVAKEVQPGPYRGNAFMGPVINERQFNRIQEMIRSGIEDGAKLVTGGSGKPRGLEKGYYVRPTIFSHTTSDMKIVQEEIFGPVLVIQEYRDVEEAVDLANSTEFGLAAYVQGADLTTLRHLAPRLAAGQVYLNGSGLDLIDMAAPFGGFKHSGNGREWGPYGLDEYTEIQAIVGLSGVSANGTDLRL